MNSLKNNKIISDLVTSISTINPTNTDEVDEFFDTVLASRKFSKVADLIAEKTILKLWNFNNTILNITNHQYVKVDEKVRRNTKDDEKSLQNLSLKYTKLRNQLNNGENLIFKATSSNDSNSESNEIDKTHEDTTKRANGSTFIYLKEKENSSLNNKFTVDFFDLNKQKDLNKKNTGRKEGHKIFVFQSSSEYEEYHEKVEKILKNMKHTKIDNI